MKRTLAIALAVLITLGAALPASGAQVELITADGTVHQVEVDLPQPETDGPPQKHSDVPFRNGTGTTYNLDRSMQMVASSTLYVGGTYFHKFQYWDDTTTKITYRFDKANSTGRIKLNRETGIFTVTKAGPIIIEIWADGQYAMDSYFRYVEAEKPDPNAVLAEYPSLAMPRRVLSDEALYAYGVYAVECTNKERAAQGLPALVMDDTLMATAAVRAKELRKEFSHTRPGGQQANEYIRQRSGASAAGENIAKGQSSGAQAVAAWMDSPTHRDNLLRASYTRVGIGCYEDANGNLYWAQVFTV